MTMRCGSPWMAFFHLNIHFRALSKDGPQIWLELKISVAPVPDMSRTCPGHVPNVLFWASKHPIVRTPYAEGHGCHKSLVSWKACSHERTHI